MKDRCENAAMHTPRPQKQGQTVPRQKKVGLQSHSGTPSHSSATNSFRGAVASDSQRKSSTPRCNSVTPMDENAVSMHVRPLGSNTRDGQIVSVARRDETLRYVTAMFDRQDMMQRTIDEQAQRIQDLAAAQDITGQANSNHTTRISKLEQENQELKARKKQYKAENEKHRSEKEVLKKNAATYKANLTTSSIEKDELAKENAELERRLIAAEQKITGQIQVQIRMESERNQLHANVEELEKLNVASESRALVHEQGNETLREEASKLNAELEALRTAKQSLLKNNSTLAAKKRDVDEQHRKLLREVDNLQASSAKRAEDSSNIEALTDEIEFLRQDNTELKDKLEKVSDDNRRQVEELVAQQSAIEHLAAHNNELLKGTDKDNDALLQQLDVQRIRIEEQQSSINHFRENLGKIDQLLQQKKVAETVAATQAVELEQLQSDLEQSKQQTGEAQRSDVRSATRACELLSRLHVLERSTSELYEFVYAETLRMASSHEEHAYIFAIMQNLAEMDGTTGCAEITTLQASNKELEKTLQSRNDDVRKLKAELAELDSLKDEIEPLKRDLKEKEAVSMQLRSELDVCRQDVKENKASKEQLRFELDACKQDLGSVKEDRHHLRAENSRTYGELALARSDAGIAEKKLNEQLEELRASLGSALISEVKLKEDLLRLEARETPPAPRNIDQPVRAGKRYASKHFVEAETFGTDNKPTALGEQFWCSIERLYQEVPDHRVAVIINERVLPRGGERLGQGDVAVLAEEPTPGESLPPTADLAEVEMLRRRWTLTTIDTRGLSLQKPYADGMLDDFTPSAVSESAEDNDLAAEDDSLFVPGGSPSPADNALAPSVQPGKEAQQQARWDSITNKETRFVPPPAVMAPSNSTQSPSTKETNSSRPWPEVTISTDMNSTLTPQSLPTPGPTPAEHRVAKNVQWAQDLVTPVGADRQSAGGSPSLKRPAPDSNAEVDATKRPRLQRSKDQGGRRIRCWDDPKCMRDNCYMAHQTPATAVKISNVDVTRLCDLEEHCKDAGCILSHASWSRCMKIPPREGRPQHAESYSTSINRRQKRCVHDPKCRRDNCYNAHQTSATSVKVDIDVAKVCDMEEDCKDPYCRLSHASWTRCMKIPPRRKSFLDPRLEDTRSATDPRLSRGAHGL